MMKGWLKGLIGVFIAVLLLGVPLISSYNGLVTEESNVDVQWANVETKLQRRYDLIPNLVESVKGAMEQEQEVFGAIADARARIGSAQTTEEQVTASNEMESALSRLLVIVENYPELKSNEQVTALMDELAGTENRISVERDRYNESVQQYNNKVKRFPGSLMAGLFGFDEKSYFEAVSGAETAPSVDLNTDDE
ncbi:MULTISPECIES: LemA family protein [Trichococcus]|uniref:LemA protein n=2 Tax=root TaxID=1 RepID=A0AB37ZX22_9LACT|nr:MULTISPECIES: LemA family protein [Trichococcus]CZQ81008.1 lema [Trichococcus collinsii]SDZ91216.1 LemA protein [Trichococcus collinsii]